MTEIERIRICQVLASRLVQLASAAPTHTLSLEALMTAYVAIAEAHSCCTQDAGRAAVRCGERLVAHVSNPGASGALH